MKHPSAQIAKAIIEAVYQEHGGEAVAWLVEPSIVLTLAGARGIGEAVIYYNNQKQLAQHQKIARYLKPILSQHSVYLKTQCSKTPFKANIFTADIFVPAGLEYALSQSKLAAIVPKDDTPGALHQWQRQLVSKLAKSHQLSKNQAADVAMGLMLGYPDPAILGMLPYWGKDTQEATREARIRYGSKHQGAQPVYDYPKPLSNDPQIIRHERLWSGILRSFYHSSIYGRIYQDPAFVQIRRKMAEADKIAMAKI